jgi:hypothetical protein
VSTGIAEPRIVADTWRYVPLALKFSNLQKKMAKQAGFQLFDKSGYPDRIESWAQEIHKEMINELFSVLFLVHDDPKSKAFSDWLLKHTDQQNCPDWSFLGFTWKTFFHASIGRYVTGVVTANWKKSLSEVYCQEDVIGHAAEQIDALFQATPEYLRKVTSQTLCPIDWPTAYKELPIHTDPFVHLSPLLFSINRLWTYLLETLGIRLLAYL